MSVIVPDTLEQLYVEMTRKHAAGVQSVWPRGANEPLFGVLSDCAKALATVAGVLSRYDGGDGLDGDIEALIRLSSKWLLLADEVARLERAEQRHE